MKGTAAGIRRQVRYAMFTNGLSGHILDEIGKRVKVRHEKRWRMAVHIGTCSWTDETLIESSVFYLEPRMSAEERLRFYAANFDTVEVDSTFYVLPSEKVAGLQAERTPGDISYIRLHGRNRENWSISYPRSRVKFMRCSILLGHPQDT